jgi:hypothetical protein
MLSSLSVIQLSLNRRRNCAPTHGNNSEARSRNCQRRALPSSPTPSRHPFYTVNKRQIFLNSNKRMSTLCLLVFLGVNGKEFAVKPDALTEKALWLANTNSLEFPAESNHNQLPKIILGVRFTDGVEVVRPQAQAAAA